MVIAAGSPLIVLEIVMKKKPESNRILPAPRWAPVNRPGVTEFIRAAESFVQAGKYTAALEQLARAHRIEPGNKYILAITERVEELKRNPPAPKRIIQDDPFSSGLDSGRYLSITVGNEFEDGIRRETPPVPQSAPFDLIKELTDIARGLASLGHVESAFDALMRAYLIDPMSPEVISCEATVLPLWNQSHTIAASPTVTISDIPAPAPEIEVSVVPELATPNVQTEPPASKPIPSITKPPSSKRPRSPQDESQRLEFLKQQKELERLERERAAYREASSIPRILRLNPWDDTSADDSGSSAESRNFLRRFRGKHS